MPELDLFQNIWVNLAVVIGGSLSVVFLIDRFSKVGWRKVDGLALCLGAVGFLVPAFEVQRTGFELEAAAQRGWSVGELSGLENVTDIMLANCRPSIRSEFSPSDFDLLVEERKQVCAWAETLNAFVATLDQDNILKIPPKLVASFPTVRKVPVGYHKEKFLEFINEWNTHVTERSLADEQVLEGAPRWLVLLFPYLLALAFSLALSGIFLKPRC